MARNHLLPDLDQETYGGGRENTLSYDKQFYDLTVREVLELAKKGLTVFITDTPKGPTVVIVNSISDFLKELKGIKSSSSEGNNYSEEDIEPIVRRNPSAKSKKRFSFDARDSFNEDW